MTNEFPSTNLKLFFSKTDLISADALQAIHKLRVNCPKLVKMAIFKPHNFTKNDHRWNIFSNFSSGQKYFLNDIETVRQKWLVKKSKFVWKENHPEHKSSVTFVTKVATKNPPEHKYSVFFITKMGTKNPQDNYSVVFVLSRNKKNLLEFLEFLRLSTNLSGLSLQNL